MAKLFLFEPSDGSGRKMYLENDAADYFVTMERDGAATGFRVRLAVIRLAETIKHSSLPIPYADWDAAVDALEALNVQSAATT